MNNQLAKPFSRIIVCLGLLLGLFHQPALSADDENLIKQFGAAFNAHDSAKMASMVTDDFELYYVNARGKAEIATRGPDALRKEMAGYFKALPSVQSSFEKFNQVGEFASFRETARWKDKKSGQEKTQSSLAVYQIKGAKIVRVWYYPAATQP